MDGCENRPIGPSLLTVLRCYPQLGRAPGDLIILFLNTEREVMSQQILVITNLRVQSVECRSSGPGCFQRSGWTVTDGPVLCPLPVTVTEGHVCSAKVIGQGWLQWKSSHGWIPHPTLDIHVLLSTRNGCVCWCVCVLLCVCWCVCCCVNVDE